MTRRSKLATTWIGIPVETLLSDADVDGDFVGVSSYGAYPAILPSDDLLYGKAWVTFEYDGEPLDPEHDGKDAYSSPT